MKEAISGKIAQISLSFMQQGSKKRLKNCEILYSLTQFGPNLYINLDDAYRILIDLVSFSMFIESIYLLSFLSEKAIKRNKTLL